MVGEFSQNGKNYKFQTILWKKTNIDSGQFLMSANIGGKKCIFVHFYHPVIFLEKTDDVVGLEIDTFLRQKT